MPLTHFTMQLEYRGLSRMGRSLLAEVGQAPSARGYDGNKKKLLEAYDAKVTEMVTCNGAIVTWDNFCHTYNSPSLSARRSSNLQANFTVVGLNRYEFKQRPAFVFTYVEPTGSKLG